MPQRQLLTPKKAERVSPCRNVVTGRILKNSFTPENQEQRESGGGMEMLLTPQTPIKTQTTIPQELGISNRSFFLFLIISIQDMINGKGEVRKKNPRKKKMLKQSSE